MGYRLEGRGSIPGRDKRLFSLLRIHIDSGPTQPLIQWVPGNFFSWVKGLVREADHSPTSRAEVKENGAIPPLPPYVLMLWRLIKHRNDCTFIQI
jgi:hypothetical protein